MIVQRLGRYVPRFIESLPARVLLWPYSRRGAGWPWFDYGRLCSQEGVDWRVRNSPVTDTPSLRRAYDNIYSNQGILHSDSFYLDPESASSPTGVAIARHCVWSGQVACAGYAIRFASGWCEILHFRLCWQATDQGVGLGVANGEQLPFSDAAFDYVTNIGSLEHYIDPQAGMREITRLLTPDGLACILLPNSFSLMANFLCAWHTGRTSDDGQPIQRFTARYEWQDLLEANGLRVIHTVKYECERPRPRNDFQALLTIPKSFVTFVAYADRSYQSGEFVCVYVRSGFLKCLLDSTDHVKSRLHIGIQRFLPMLVYHLGFT